MNQFSLSSNTTKILFLQILLAVLGSWNPVYAAEDRKIASQKVDERFHDYDYERSKKIAKAILSQYSPENFVVVVLGRSLTTVAAVLQEVTKDYCFNLPLSALRARPDSSIPRDRPRAPRRELLLYKALSKEHESSLFTHFDVYVPNGAKVLGREIVVLDYTIWGHNAFSSGYYLDRYFSKKKRPKIKELGLLPSTSVNAEVDPYEDLVRLYDISYKFIRISRSDNAEVAAFKLSLNNERFKELSEFGQFHPDPRIARIKNLEPLKKTSRIEYLTLKNKIRQKLKVDPNIGNELRGCARLFSLLR